MNILEKIDKFLTERKWLQGPGERRSFRKGKYDFDTRSGDTSNRVTVCPECGAKGDDMMRIKDHTGETYSKCQLCSWNNKKGKKR